MTHLLCFPPTSLVLLSQIFARSSHSLRLNVCVPHLGAGALLLSIYTHSLKELIWSLGYKYQPPISSS